MKFKTLFFVFAFSIASISSAQGLQQELISSVVNAYHFYKDVDSLAISTPTVLEVSFADEFIERFDFAVLNKTTNLFEPYVFKQEMLINEIPVSVGTIPKIDNADKMVDKNTITYAEFLLYENIQNKAQITLSSASPITSSLLTILLDDNVALPISVEIRATIDGQSRIVVANRRMDQQTIRFPQTTSNEWVIIFTFGQPLRISELRLNQDNATKSSARAIRFLAQPDHSYRIYFDPDRSTVVPVGEVGNLFSTKDVIVISTVPFEDNPNYIIADVDNDSIPDISDNCVSVSNSDQQDINNNGRGDVCDDFDQDGLINSKDNCPDNPNRNQKDIDSDGIGDICDKEESRITERYPWLPWLGIGFAAIVLVGLFILTARSTYIAKQDNNQ